MRAQRLLRGSHFRQTASRYLFGHARTLAVAAALVSTLLPALASAATAISQGYMTSDDLTLGSMVSLEKNTTDRVKAATTTNVDGLLGIVINSDSSLLSVTNGQDNQVQVATSGTIQVLVSDINGPVEQGDHITASPLAGIGMRASANVRVIGVAQSDMKSASKQSYKDKDGKQHEVMIGQVPVLVNVAYYFKEPEKTVIPGALQNVANALAGKEVSTLPILLSSGIFVVMLIVVCSIVYSMIRSSIISVGRNPMSQSAIYRDLIQLSALVLAILGVGLLSIYLILTRL